MRKDWPLSLGFLLVMSLLALAIYFVLAKKPAGKVVGKRVRPPYTTMYWVSHGKNGGGHMQVVNHPESYVLQLRAGEDSQEVSVPFEKYSSTEIGDWYGCEEEN